MSMGTPTFCMMVGRETNGSRVMHGGEGGTSETTVKKRSLAERNALVNFGIAVKLF